MPARAVIFSPGPLRGTVDVPGDKSISHRALIAGARCAMPLRIARLNPGRDVRATQQALTALGARIGEDRGNVTVAGGGLTAPGATLDCMNSGSTARMLLGVCAGDGIRARFDGDHSLRARPMEPVAAQLRAFGARIETTQGRLPLEVLGTPEIQTRRFILLAPSAQVKSALLFAGLFADVAIEVSGDRGSRDHTERLLRYLGAEIEWDGKTVRLGRSALTGTEVEVVGDFSAAAFFIVAAAIAPGSAVLVRNVGVNPTRTGLIEALSAMGAAIQLRNRRQICNEPVADISVEWSQLEGASIGGDVALRAIDELPLLAVAGAFAAGTTTIAGATDLRSKESDRIAAVERLLLGVGIESSFDRGTLRVQGGVPRGTGAEVVSHGDHRIAMATAVLGCAAGPLALDSDESLDVSFPGFLTALSRLRG